MSKILTNADLEAYVNTDHAIHYIKEIYKNCIDADPAWMVEVRKIGQYHMVDGTQQQAEQSSAAQLLQFDQDDWQPGLAQWVAKQCLNAAPVGIGAFLAPALLNDRRANDQSVQALTTVCADFDTGFPKQALEELIKRIGTRPTFIVHSGGTTKEGNPKLHAHWRLDEPCLEPWKIAYIREQIALLFGADTSFKRIPQIIRIPGALYDKQGQWGTTTIEEWNDHDVGLMQWEESLLIDWENLAEESIFNKGAKKRTKEEKVERMQALQTEVVEEGRVADTRWDRFSEYAGHQIRQARFQYQSVEDALASTKLWVLDKMVPAWEEDRVEAEFKALLQRDRVNNEEVWADHGKPPIIFNNQPINSNQPSIDVLGVEDGQLQESTEEEWSIEKFDVADYYSGPAPAERHLIENFLVHGSNTAVIADGGVGKTYFCIELGLRLAAGPSSNNNQFLGFDILEKARVIILTVEDGKEDIHRRVCAVDPDESLRKAAGRHCAIIPVQEEIMNGLTLVELDSKGNLGPSVAWKAMLGFIETHLQNVQLHDDEDFPLVVIIDTYSATHHADENSSVGTNQWFRSAALLKKFKATLVITHHVRKADPRMEIKTPADMRLSVRGSTAFLNSVRFAIGLWPMPNSNSVLSELDRPNISRLINMAILKNNTGINWDGLGDSKFTDPIITLSRAQSGQIHFNAETHEKRKELGELKSQRKDQYLLQLRAALIHVVKMLSGQGWAPSLSQLVEEKSTLLPEPINRMTKNCIKSAVNQLLEEGKLRKIDKIVGVPRGAGLDIPDGPFSSGMIIQRVIECPQIDWAKYAYNEDTNAYDDLSDAFGNDFRPNQPKR